MERGISVTTITSEQVRVDLPFSPGWNRLPGLTVEDNQLTLTGDFFLRCESPSWLLCDWDLVRREVLPLTESADAALEQQVLDFVRTHGRWTHDPDEVLQTAWQVYSYLFREEHLADPGLSWATPQMLTALRECATLMALNKVEENGQISNVNHAWMFGAAVTVVYDFTDEEAEQVDELYHSTWFHEGRHVESIKAHAALGGRLVHGCQSRANMSGGVVAPYGTNIAVFHDELSAFRDEWIDRIMACRPRR